MQIAGSSQQPFLGQSSACIGMLSLGETSQAMVTVTDRKALKSLAIQLSLVVQKKSKNGEKRLDKCVSWKAAAEVSTATAMEGAEIVTVDEKTPTCEGIGLEVGQHGMYRFLVFYNISLWICAFWWTLVFQYLGMFFYYWFDTCICRPLTTEWWASVQGCRTKVKRIPVHTTCSCFLKRMTVPRDQTQKVKL